MATKDVKIPDIGEGVTEGELVKYLVKPGDKVQVDQAIAEIMTDKATVEVPSPYSGTVKELKFKEGDVIAVETTILTLEGDAAATTAPAPKPAAASKSSPAPAAPAVSAKSAPAASAPAAAMTSAESRIYPPAADMKILATPGTRRLAREMNVDINAVQGSGLAGRVTRDDLMKAKSQGTGAVAAGQPTMAIPRMAYQSPAGAIEERVPMRGIRRKIAQAMQTAKHIVPHFTIMDEANVTELVKLRERAREYGEQHGVKVTFLPFIMKALIATLREFPMLNASIDDAAEDIVYKKYFNIGFAADTPNGLLVPVIKNADQKTILEISKEIVELATKARDGKIGVEDMKGATITITNIGSIGGAYATPIINHPEVAIIGMYKIVDRPLLVNGQFQPIKMMNLTATCDHRLIDGAVAARFLKALVGRIENPGQLMMEMV